MKYLSELIFCTIIMCTVLLNAQNSITISEVMFNPEGNNSEFVELYNKSNTTAVNLEGFIIQYFNSKPDTIVAVAGLPLLKPNGYAVIFENDYDIAAGVYAGTIPLDAILLKIKDNSFGSTGMANSTGRAVTLCNADSTIIESYTYSANNSKGYSDEKITLNLSNLPVNWGNSTVPNGTPGMVNSVAIKEYDPAVSNVFVLPETLYSNKATALFWTVKNNGSNNLLDVKSRIYLDYNNNYVNDGDELIDEVVTDYIMTGDSVNANYNLGVLPGGEYRYLVYVHHNNDMVFDNNLDYVEFEVLQSSANWGDIVITEFQPAPVNDEPEWIEIKNISGDEVNLKDWRIADNSSSRIIAHENLIVGDNERLILSADSLIVNYYPWEFRYHSLSIPSLNNSGDILTLYDHNDNEISIVEYNSEWNTLPGNSIEKVIDSLNVNDTTNWKTNRLIYNGSPGIENSVSPHISNVLINEVIVDTEIPVLDEDLNFAIRIKDEGIETANDVTVKLFRDDNLNDLPDFNEQINVWNGITFYGLDSLDINYNYTPSDTGFTKFIVTLEGDNYFPDNIFYFDITVVPYLLKTNDLQVTEFMAVPASGTPEYIELFNSSIHTIDLYNFSVSDNSSTYNIKSQYFLQPDSFVVICEEDINNFSFPAVDNLLIESLPTLNNNEDKIVIKDNYSRTIDSLFYDDSWEPERSKSKEKIDLSVTGNGYSNWENSTLTFGGSPGFINSVTPKRNDVRIDSVLYPNAILKGDMVNVSLFISNHGTNIVTNSTIELQSETGWIYSGITGQLQPNEYTTIMFEHSFPDTGYVEIIGEVITQGDLYPYDNSYKFSLYVNPKDSTTTPANIVINEFMGYPQSGEPEWIELYNDGAEGIVLSELLIADATSSRAVEFENYLLNSGEYLVITRDKINIPTVADTSGFVTANFPALNNSGDIIKIVDINGVILDSLEYNSSWGLKNGVSMERISTNLSSVDNNNWSESDTTTGGTPGYINYISPKLHDPEVIEVSVNPAKYFRGDSLSLQIKINERGSRSTDFQLSVFVDSVKIYTDNYTSIADSITTINTLNLIKYEKNSLISTEIISNDDLYPFNNSTSCLLEGSTKSGTVLINEIMVSPSDGIEWIELYNNNAEALDLKNWQLWIGQRSYTISEESKILPAKEYLFVGNTNIFECNNYAEINITLPNNGSEIILKDNTGNLIDSIGYAPKIVKHGKSAERYINTNDFYVCIDSLGSTPGKPNSVNYLAPYAQNSILFNEIMYDDSGIYPEYIEFYILPDEYISLGGMQVTVNNNSYDFFPELHKVNDLYVVIAADTLAGVDNMYVNSGFRLPNSGAEVKLYDMFGTLVDSMYYSPELHTAVISGTEGKSLEKNSVELLSEIPKNWKTSMSETGGTPGAKNSVIIEDVKIEPGIKLFPNPFSPDNDGFEDITTISYSLNENVNNINIYVFDSIGRKVKTIAENLYTLPAGEIEYNGTDNSGNALKMGIYILYIEGTKGNGGKIEDRKIPFVIARKL